jgi:hypothetical protein
MAMRLFPVTGINTAEGGPNATLQEKISALRRIRTNRKHKENMIASVCAVSGFMVVL